VVDVSVELNEDVLSVVVWKDVVDVAVELSVVV
jgi:hypothetical protein